MAYDIHDIGIAESLEQPYKARLRIFYDCQDCDNVYNYHYARKPGMRTTNKHIFIGRKCNHECGARLYHCLFDSHTYDSNFPCPYVYDIVKFQEPRTNNALYPDWVLLGQKINTRATLGDYAVWALRNRDFEIDKQLYETIKNIPEFSLENLTNLPSLETCKTRIEQNPQQFTTKIFMPNYISTLVNSIINYYSQELTAYRDGLLLRTFISDAEYEYRKWKDENTISIIKVGDYYIVHTFLLMAQSLDRANQLYLDRTNQLGEDTHYIHFHKSNITKVYKALTNFVNNNINCKEIMIFECRALLEQIIKIMEVNNDEEKETTI